MLTNGAARCLPNGKAISVLGFGCSSAWSKSSFPADRAAEMLKQAVAEGINHFDTAPSYAEGETRLGMFLKGRDPSSLVISTKVGTEHGDHKRSFDSERMRASFENSLARLGVPSIDILYLHGPKVENLTPDVFNFFSTLKAEGRISYSGVNSFDPTVVAASILTPIDAIMLQYSIADRTFDSLIKQVVGSGKIVIAGTILGQSIFDLSKFIPRDRKSLWYLMRAIRNDPLFVFKGRRLSKRLTRLGLDPHEAAVRFAVSNLLITSNLFGTSNPRNLVANARAGRNRLSNAQISVLTGGEA
jgi:D-threo-aldose 1-dehydrogenase